MAPALPRMRLSEFLSQLSEVHDVTDEDECPVCLQNYNTTTAPAPGIIQGFLSMFVRQGPEPIEPEHAIRLPCKHIIGSSCIKRWLSPEEGPDTCPFCVQQLFTPAEHPVCNHPDWEMLMDLLGDYGFILERNWTWTWRPTETIARITKKDILDCVMLAKTTAATLKEHLLADENAVDYLRHLHQSATMLADFDPERPLAADQKTVDHVLERVCFRLTLHLRETAWYLDLPALGRIRRENPFRTLQKHHEDTLFKKMDRDGLFDNETGSLSHREIWNLWRNLGVNPMDLIKSEPYGLRSFIILVCMKPRRSVSCR